MCIPFAWMHPAVNQKVLVNQDWLGYVEPSSSGIFIDNYLLLIFGGIPYQVSINLLMSGFVRIYFFKWKHFHDISKAYFQRVLSAKTSRQAQWLSYIAALLCTLLSIPSILLGGIAKNTGRSLRVCKKKKCSTLLNRNNCPSDWLNGTEYGKSLTSPDQIKQVLPLVLNYLTPQVSYTHRNENTGPTPALP